jgi:hypothetical protein
MKQTYLCIDDPGHGWMKVTMDEIRRLGIEDKITSYSYRNGDDVYLEEDVDMSTFLDAKRALGEAFVFTSRHEENTPIRGYPAYCANP